MRPIFNESFGEKKGLWVPRTVHGTHWKALSITYFACQRGSGSRAQCTRPTDRQHLHVLLNLKKKKKRDTQHGNANPNAYLRSVWIPLILLKT